MIIKLFNFYISHTTAEAAADQPIGLTQALRKLTRFWPTARGEFQGHFLLRSMSSNNHDRADRTDFQISCS